MKKLFILIAVIGTLIPTIFVIQKAGGLSAWQGVLPHGTTDSLYYYARIHEVADGHLSIGNPYIYEYRDELTPASFLPDVLSAIPLFLGLSFNSTVVLNLFLWSFVFLILSFSLFKLLGLPKWWGVFWSVVLYVSAYSFMLRPNAMQIVYPVFLAFLVALINFLSEFRSRRDVFWLALASVATFYTYIYLAYIVLVTLGLIFLWSLLRKKFEETKRLLFLALWSGLMLIPFDIYTLVQIKSPLYMETLTRLGLVYTHLPSTESFLYGRWVVVGLVALGLFWFLFQKSTKDMFGKGLFWFSTGVGILVSLFLNTITGVELTLGVHIGRFVILWMVAILAVLLYRLYLSISPQVPKWKYAVVGISILFLSGGVARNIPRGLGFFSDRSMAKVSDVQNYAKPLHWLEENAEQESVIWANESISEYIPVMTKHYLLSFNGAVLHSIPNKELEDRFLLSRSFGSLTISDLKRDMGLYSGAGPLKDQPRAYNNEVKFCETINRFIDNKECGQPINAVTLKGEEYFINLAERFKVIKRDQKVLLEKFNVKFIVLDRTTDETKLFLLKEALYDDGRFVILSLPL